MQLYVKYIWIVKVQYTNYFGSGVIRYFADTYERGYKDNHAELPSLAFKELTEDEYNTIVSSSLGPVAISPKGDLHQADIVSFFRVVADEAYNNAR